MSDKQARGLWKIKMLGHGPGDSGIVAIVDAALDISKCHRQVVEASLMLEGLQIPLVGKMRPGTPTVISMTCADPEANKAFASLQIVAFIPVAWQNNDYDYDVIFGSIAPNGAPFSKSLSIEGSPISFAGSKKY
jgi:hypothetical protein